MPPPGVTRRRDYGRCKGPYLELPLCANPEGRRGTPRSELNHFQFLTIRQYLSLVFVALVFLLFGLTLWP